MSRILVLLGIILLAGCAQFDPVPAHDYEAGHAWADRLMIHAELDVKLYEDGELMDEDSDSDSESYRHELLTLTTLAEIESIRGTLFAGTLRLESGPLADEGVPYGIFLSEDENLHVVEMVNGAPSLSEGEQAIDFPLEEGKSWKQSVDSADESYWTVTVGQMESVTTALGTFDGVRMDLKLRSNSDLAQELREEFESNPDVSNVKIDAKVTGSGTSWYVEEVGSVVKSEGGIGLRLDLRFTVDGKDIRILTTSQVQSESELVAFDLTGTNDPGLQQALNSLTGEAPIEFPDEPTNTPGNPNSESKPLVIRMDADELMVGDTMTATIEGAAGSPIEYQVLDATGLVLDAGAGRSITFVPEAGAYQIVARAIDNSEILDEESRKFWVDQELQLTPTCTIALDGVLACDAVAIPVRPGVTSATVSVVDQNLGLIGLPGELRYSDGAFAASQSTLTGTATLSANLPDKENREDAELVWQPVVGALDEATIQVTLHASPQAATSGMTSAGAKFLAPYLDAWMNEQRTQLSPFQLAAQREVHPH